MSRHFKNKDKDIDVIHYIDSLTEKQLFDTCVAMALRLIETEEVFYRPAGDELPEGLFWESCGESVGELS